MSRRISASVPRTIRLFAALAVLLGIVQTSAARAQDSAVEWTQTRLIEPVRRLYTPASGALLARTNNGLVRSDDAGDTWRDVPLPNAPDGKPVGLIVVDPTNHATIYAATSAGIYKSDDDAGTWRLLVPADPKFTHVRALAVSPANPRVVYLMQTTETDQSIRFQRSTDGGETWTEPDPALDPANLRPVMPCYWSVSLLKPHPTDETRLIRAAACYARGDYVTVKESTDQGATWRSLYMPARADPRWLVGQQADAPDRLILGSNRELPAGNYIIHRSDDGGTTWATMQEYRGGGSSMRGPDLAISGLAMDPTRSDRLLLALNASGRHEPAPAPLQVSLDDGQTWSEYSPEGLGEVNDVAFGIDGKLLFAATETGLWRAAAP
jgi:photosystem II stability/assembly factor-like uncharacterized protein